MNVIDRLPDLKVGDRLPEVSIRPRQLSFAERAVSAVVGLGLAAAAAKPRPNPVLSVLALAAGSYLAWRGSSGKDPLGIALMSDDEDAAA